MTASVALGILCGTGLGVGLWSLVSLTPRFGRPRLADRLAPYILDVSAEARSVVARRTVDPLPVLGALFGPVAGRLTALLAVALGGTETIQRRLRQSGSGSTADQFRAEQLVWILFGLAAGAVAVVAIPALHAVPLLVQVMVPLVAGLCGALGRDRMLQRAAQARLARLTGELPTLLEFLTLSLSSGEGILDSLRRVSKTSSGELSREFAAAVAEVHTGVPLGQALQDLASRIQLPALSRCIEHISGALERGSPLAEVLRAQAQDTREEGKRDLLEIAGKKEVVMLIPLVFLILPMTILFAIFPGIFVLQAGF